MSIATLLLVPLAAASGGAPSSEEAIPEVPSSTPTVRQVMRPWGQLQIFGTVFDQDESVQADPASYGDPEADPGFQVARGRFGFTGELPLRNPDAPVVDYGLSLGIATPYDALRLGDSGVSMVDAFGRVTFTPGLGDTVVSLGLVKVPFSREALMSSQDLVFMERAVGAENLTSVRDVGVLGRQEIDLGSAEDAPVIAISAGAFNGNNDFLGDEDPGIMGAGRVEFEKGDTNRTWSPEQDTAIGVGGSFLYNSELALRTTAFSADAFLRTGPFSLMAELGMSTLTPTATDLGEPGVFTSTTRMGWTAATSYYRPFGDATKPEPMGLEVAVRASSLDDNRNLSDNGDVLVVHGGATLRSVLPMFDLGVGYIHRTELGGRKLPNDSLRVWAQFRPRG